MTRFETIAKRCAENNCILLTTEEEFEGSTKTKLKYACPSCKKEDEKWYRSLLSSSFKCKTCSQQMTATGKNRQENFESLKRQFSDKGFKLLTTIGDYINTKTILKYECSKGHQAETTQNRFNTTIEKNGCVCSKCATKERSAFCKAQVRFSSLGLTLLTTKEQYKDKTTQMDYICHCGFKCQVSWVTARNPNWKECFYCENNLDRDEI